MHKAAIFALLFLLLEAVSCGLIGAGLLGAGLIGAGALKGYLAGRNYYGHYGYNGPYYGGYYGGYYPGYYSGYYGHYNHYRRKREAPKEHMPHDQVLEDIAKLDGDTKCVRKLICEIRSNYDSKLLKFKHSIDQMIKELAHAENGGMAAKSFQEADFVGRFRPADCKKTYDKCPYTLHEMVKIINAEEE